MEAEWALNTSQRKGLYGCVKPCNGKADTCILQLLHEASAAFKGNDMVDNACLECDLWNA